MKKWIKRLALAVTGLGLFIQGGFTAQAAESWDKPAVVYGSGLSEAERNQTAVQLGVNDQDVNEITIDSTDFEKYLGYPTNDASMISSVAVKRTGKSGGVNVTISTPKNITLITKEQYMNAAFTAGVENADIDVASVRQVTGESALTGVYKAFEANGETLDNDRMEVAQEELETTSGIAKDLNDDQSSHLDAAIIEIKQQLAALKERTDKLATREDIEKIINDALAKYDLSSVISKDQIDRLISLFEKYQKTGAIDSAKIKEQLGNLKNKLGKVWQEAEESGLLDKIGQFFRDIWQAILDLFN